MHAFPFCVPLLLQVPITSKCPMRTSFAVQMFAWEIPEASRRQRPPLVPARAVPIACREKAMVRTVESRGLRFALRIAGWDVPVI